MLDFEKYKFLYSCSDKYTIFSFFFNMNLGAHTYLKQSPHNKKDGDLKSSTSCEQNCAQQCVICGVSHSCHVKAEKNVLVFHHCTLV